MNIKFALSNRRLKKGIEHEKRYLSDTRNGIIGHKASFGTIEAYRSTRTNIMFSMVDEEGCKKLLFTSAMAGEGKTTTCINMAITLAQTGINVLVVDADLRRPRIHTYFELANDVGLSNVLVGLAQLDDVIQTKDGIDFITSGYMPQNPAELLSSKKMEEVLGELSNRYDYIILDTPPVGVVTDATSIIKLCTGVVFVVRQNYTVHSAIRSAFSALNFANAKILGFILNDAESPDSKYKRGKYKKYANYHYYGEYGQYGSTAGKAEGKSQ